MKEKTGDDETYYNMGLVDDMERSRSFDNWAAAQAEAARLRKKVKRRRGNGRFVANISPNVGGGFHIAVYGAGNTFKGYIR